MKPELSNYRGREQTYFKHLFLGNYLIQCGIKVGSRADSFTYIEGFSGPWRNESQKLEDTSFSIALSRLREARDTVKKTFGRDLRLRAYFIEKDPEAYRRLNAYASEQRDIEIKTKRSTFEESISEAVAFAQGGATSNFTFTFVDPTSWRGFALRRVSPLLSLKWSECLINLQTGFIKRFITIRESHQSFLELFDSSEPMEVVLGLAEDDREEYIIREYARRVHLAGRFDYDSAAVVPRPDKERIQFHLIYLTRSRKGVSAFKDAEKSMVEEMPGIRGRAKQRRRVEQSGQQEFQAMAETPSLYLDRIAARCRGAAWKQIQQEIEKSQRLPYDRAFDIAMTYPLVWEQHLKEWILENSSIVIDGLGPKERVPKIGKGHALRLK